MLLLFLFAGCFGDDLQAQVAAPTDAQVQQHLQQLDVAVQNAQLSADNGWMLVSAALVLMMTIPGLALFYGGLVRKKNVLSTMMHSFAMAGIISVVWAFVGFSLCFGSGTRFIGGFHHLFLHGVGSAPDPAYAATIPLATFMIYQLMFAIITPALISGAFAERMKFSAMALFTLLWSLFVYAPMAHMVWGKDGLLNASLTGGIPTLDFAGGTVVHITSGVSALVCALYLGKRLHYPKEPMPPHSVVLSFIGAGLLWVGWFGFNAGSALSAGPWPPAPLSPLILVQPLRPLDGAWQSGFATASPAPWEPSREPSQVWSPSLRQPVLSDPCRRLPLAFSPACSATLWSPR